MDVQISHCVHPEISPQGDIQPDQKGYFGIYHNTVQIQRCTDNRRAYDARPCASDPVHSAQNGSIKFHGLPQGKIISDDFRESRQSEIQVRKQEVLGGRLLCLDCRPERSHDSKVCSGSGESRYSFGQTERQGIRRSVQEARSDKTPLGVEATEVNHNRV